MHKMRHWRLSQGLGFLGVPPTSCSQLALEESELGEGAVEGAVDNNQWTLTGHKRYTVALGYNWLHGSSTAFPLSHVVWCSSSTPKHRFILWLVVHRKLLTRDRLNKWYGCRIDDICSLCE